MTSDGENDSEALTGGDLTKNRALVARVSNLSQDRPDLKFPSMPAWRAMANPTVDTSLASRERSAGSVGNGAATWKRTRTQTGEATQPLAISVGQNHHERRALSGGVDEKAAGGVCPAPRANCTRRPKLRHKGWGYKVWRRTWE